MDEADRLRKAYLFPIAISALCHIATFAVIAFGSFTFSEVFMPPLFYPCEKMESMSAGIHNFFQYDQYVWSAAALVWVAVLETNSRGAMRPGEWAILALKVFGLSVLAGPAGTVLGTLWRRDHRILGFDCLEAN